MVSNSQQESVIENIVGDIQHKWGWLLALGILFIILGTVGLGMTFAITMASMLFFGFLMLFGGAFQFFYSFQCKGWKNIGLHLLAAIVYLIGGLVIINDPLLASEVITIMIAVVLMMVGAMRIVMAVQMSAVKGWWLTLLSGIISVIFGGMVMTAWPVSGMWLIGLLIAVDLILHGWGFVIIALAAKKPAQA